MKIIQCLLCAVVLFAAGICFATIVPGNQVAVIDVNSPYYLHIGTVVAVQDSGTPFEVDTVHISGVFVDFDASQLNVFPSVRPRK